MKTSNCIIILIFFLNSQLSYVFSSYHSNKNNFNRIKPTYKFTYFDARLRGEFIRFILSYSGIEFEDNRVKPEDWPALKPQTPFGQVPVLEIKRGSEVIEIAQSQAIARYLARKSGLNGMNSIETALIDMYGAQMGDLFDALGNAFNSNQTENFYKQVWPRNFQFFEDRLAKNGNGFLVGRRLSWADIYLSQFTDFLGDGREEMLKQFPLIKALDEKVRSIPGIANWIQKRPAGGF
uniref:glutathione transferase n=1 Tax=Brachionus rotundiformis TaxID=96890 RepID=A0A3G2JSE4_9BILA|nr:glutathione S-transferase S7 [Brachionus rotundiformis]